MGNVGGGVTVDCASGKDETVIWIRVQRPEAILPADVLMETTVRLTGLLREAEVEAARKLAVMERRALDAERAALDAGKANADAIAAAVKDAMARLAAEFAAEASSGTYGQWRRETFEACSARCRELAK